MSIYKKLREATKKIAKGGKKIKPKSKPTQLPPKGVMGGKPAKYTDKDLADAYSEKGDQDGTPGG